jgi:hypothetical protein
MSSKVPGMKEVFAHLFTEEPEGDDEEKKEKAPEKEYDLAFPVAHGYDDTTRLGGEFSIHDHLRNDETQYGYDQFSKTFPEFKVKLEKRLQKFLGKDWKQFVADRAGTTPVALDRAIRLLWDGNWSDYEATTEIFHWFDCAQNEFGYDPYGIERAIKNPTKENDYFHKPNLNSQENTGLGGEGEEDDYPDYWKRPGRPVGALPNGRGLVYAGQQQKKGGGDQDDGQGSSAS